MTNKNINSDLLDKAELQLKLGLMPRRTFIKYAVTAGLSIAAASNIATASAVAAKNQIERRKNLLSKYDFIIVGGGAAGCVLADRLTEDPTIQVLVLENGNAEIDQEKITEPFFWAQNLGTETDYNRITIPQTGMNGRQISNNGGKILGGSSSINAVFWMRGDRRDYLEWERVAGANWGPESLFKVYDEKVLTKITPIKAALNHELTDPFMKAGQEIFDLPIIDANTQDSITGISHADSNILDGRRFSALNGYLLPVLDRPNLTVLVNAQVTELLFAHGQALGVRSNLEGSEQLFLANETILSAGAIESPALLMRSGVGPQGVLRRAGVPLKMHAPGVGRRLQDHGLLIPINFRSKQVLPGVVGQGVNTINNIETLHPQRPPTIQVIGTQFPFGSNAPVETTFGTMAGLMKPLSRGSMSITGPSVNDPLMINPNYFAVDVDLETMVKALDYARLLGTADSLLDYYDGELFPGPAVQTLDQKIEYVRNFTGTYFHYIGTCAMGDVANSVLDENLKVRGIGGLRVVDASVMPTIPSVNTHVPTILVAEKGAEIIKGI